MFFSINIKYLRNLKGLTQTQLAEEMGVTSSTVTGWETGKSSPHFQVLLKLHDFFDVNLEKLVYTDLQNEPTDEGFGTNSKLLQMIRDLTDRVHLLEQKVEKIGEK